MKEADGTVETQSIAGSLRVLWQNLLNRPWLAIAKALRRRGWVAFYLEPEHRTCSEGFCWLKLYKSEL